MIFRYVIPPGHGARIGSVVAVFLASLAVCRGAGPVPPAGPGKPLPPAFAMVDNFTNLLVRGGSARAPGYRVIFFNTIRFAPCGEVFARTFPYVTRSPSGRNFLVAVRPMVGNSRPATRIVEYSPTGGMTTRAVTLPGWPGADVAGSPERQPFRCGADGVLWTLEGKNICGVRWPTGKIVCSHRYVTTLGSAVMAPIAGGLVLTDILPTAAPRASTLARPRMFLLTEAGALLGIRLPGAMRGIPFFTAARGRTLSGITAFGGDFFSLTFGADGGITKWVEKKVAAGIGGYRLLNNRLGVALWESSRPGGGSRLYFIGLRTGRVSEVEKVRFRAVDIVVAAGKIFLVGPMGGVVQVGKGGKILRRSPPPVWIEGAVGPTR